MLVLPVPRLALRKWFIWTHVEDLFTSTLVDRLCDISSNPSAGCDLLCVKTGLAISELVQLVSDVIKTRLLVSSVSASISIGCTPTLSLAQTLIKPFFIIL